MKVFWLSSVLYLASLASAVSLPQSRDLSEHHAIPESTYFDVRDLSALEKRKGGGGGKGGGSGSGSGAGKGGSGSGSSSGSGSGRPPSSYSFSPSSNTGGRTVSGSGLRPAYNNRYVGGAAVPYTAGQKTPTRGVLPFALPLAAVAFFPGLWLYGSVFAYPYSTPYYYNHNGQNTTANTTCLCQRYSECGCDDNGNSTFLAQVINNGTDHPVNTSTMRFITFPNGTSIAYINGTLPNGTTASGGTDPSNAGEISGAAKFVLQYGGYWVMVAAVGAAVLLV